MLSAEPVLKRRQAEEIKISQGPLQSPAGLCSEHAWNDSFVVERYEFKWFNSNGLMILMVPCLL